MIAVSFLLALAMVGPVAASAPAQATPGDNGLLEALAGRPAVDFAQRLAAAANALPAVGESRETLVVAEAQTAQARSRLFPTLGLDVNSADTLARDFQRTSTQFESLVPRRRTDAIGSINQLLVDWGATSARIRAGQFSETAAAAEVQATRVDQTVAMVATWHEAIAARHALALATQHAVRLNELADDVVARQAAGADSAAEVARASSAAAQASARQTDVGRRDAAARARLVELFGGNAPEPERAPLPPNAGSAIDTPELRAARADAAARRAATSAASADRLPRVDARVAGSSFDLLGSGRPDYDVRATVTMTTRFGVGGAEAARVRELAATARRADFTAARIAAENARELAQAEAELVALSAALPARRTAHENAVAARDLIALRFAAARGTLFDVLVSEREALEASLALVEAELQLDVARWLVLARRGTLLGVIDDAAIPGGGR
jgi:adhesin transport system outer membrane protein